MIIANMGCEYGKGLLDLLQSTFLLQSICEENKLLCIPVESIC